MYQLFDKTGDTLGRLFNKRPGIKTVPGGFKNNL